MTELLETEVRLENGPSKRLRDADVDEIDLVPFPSH